MSPLAEPYHTTRCRICGSLVPTSNLSEHLLADARILRIIKATRPEWGRQECEDYLRALCGAKKHAEKN